MSEHETEYTDLVLVERALGGCALSFSVLFDRYYEKVRAFSHRIVLDHSLADDVAQETFIRVARKLGTLRDPRAFEAWIYRMASNVAKSVLRSRSGQLRKLLSFFQQRTDPDSIVSTADDDPGERVRQALSKLPFSQREAVSLVCFENLTHAEAAARLGCAEGTISWRMSVARETLRTHLSP